MPELEAGLFGDLSNSYIVDNSKIKSFVPGYLAITHFEVGIRQSIAYYMDNTKLQTIDEELNDKMDLMIASYEEFLSKARNRK
ncbi:MAG TPA: hypothetical protein VIK72_05430 [Clostridiaceae bacterium]